MGLLDSLLGFVKQILCAPSSSNVEDKPPSGYPGAQVAPETQQHAYPQQHHEQHRPQQAHQEHQQHGYPQQHYQQHKPQHEQHAPPPPPQHAPHSPSPPHHGRVNENLQNQQNPHYTSLRAKANQEGDAMARTFDESHSAYERGDGARAHELSEQGKRHKAEMEHLNHEASEWIFRENNTDSKPGEIDLHGLYVKEAIEYTDRSIEEAKRRGDDSIHLIVGKGLHSTNHIAKLKPAIEDLMVKHQLVAHLDPHNSGVLIVRLDGQGQDRALDADQVTRKLEQNEDGCIIM